MGKGRQAAGEYMTITNGLIFDMILNRFVPGI